MPASDHADAVAWRRLIKDRFSGRVVDPPIPARSDDGLETYLVDRHADASPRERMAMESAILELLQEARREPSPPPWLGHLFHLVPIAGTESLADQLVALFLADSARGNPSRKAPGACQPSLLPDLMHDIRELQPTKRPLAWRDYLVDPDLGQYAYYGLVEGEQEKQEEVFDLTHELFKLQAPATSKCNET